MEDKVFIFLAGLHRSGTSLLHEILRDHPQISGFSGTGVPEDEGQHLQSVYEPAKTYGGPGKFVFDKRSYMDESHELATNESAKAIYQQWCQHYDLSCKYLIEKSPPNIVKTRFLQKIFPNTRFIVILRHPIAVSLATQKWSKTSIPSLLEHSLLAYEIFLNDMKSLHNVYIIRYEDFVCEPQKIINEIFNFLDITPVNIQRHVRNDVNEKYFSMWEKALKSPENPFLSEIRTELEPRAKQCGYSLVNYHNPLSVSWLGTQSNRGIIARLFRYLCTRTSH